MIYCYYLRIDDAQYGTRYIIGITQHIPKRLRGYFRKHTTYAKVIILATFQTREEALKYEKEIVDKYWKLKRPGTTEEYFEDVLLKFQ